MQGVKFLSDNLVCEISEGSELTWYDPAHNDPPLDLREDVEEWLHTNLPSARVEYGIFDLRIRFAAEADAVLFKTFWA